MTAAASGRIPASARAIRLQLDGKIGEEQVMVDDDDVALHRPPPHFRDEAALQLAALLPRQASRAGIQFVPQLAGLGSSANSARSPVCVFFPTPRARDIVRSPPARSAPVARSGRKASCGTNNCCDLSCNKPKAECLRRQPAKQRLLQKRNVFVEKLLLQILRAGRDDHPLARTNARARDKPAFFRSQSPPPQSGAVFLPVPARPPVPSAAARGEIHTPDVSATAFPPERKIGKAKRPCRSTRRTPDLVEVEG